MTIDKSAYYVPAERGFTSPTVPTKKRFSKAKNLIKTLITRVNQETTSDIDFTQLTATIDATQKQITIKLIDNPSENYVINNETQSIVFTYNDIDFSELMLTVFGFSSTYLEDTYDDVIAVLPEGVESTYDEPTQVLTVTVKETPNVITFTDEDETLSTALLVGKSFQIAFKDKAIDLSERFHTTSMTVPLEDYSSPTV